MHERRLRVIGAGRAGRSLATALARVGWDVGDLLGRSDDPTDAAAGTDLLVIATPDALVSEVAAAVRPEPTAVVAHMAGSLGLDALAGHSRAAAIHPLVPLTDPDRGADRLAAGAWFALAGDPIGRQVVADLGGRLFLVADADRAAYHAAAVVASNHLVALLGQVDRIAADIGVPPEAYLDLARAALDDVAAQGPALALTGPAARGDWATLAGHLAAIDPGEHESYRAMAAAARRLVADDGLPAGLDVKGPQG